MLKRLGLGASNRRTIKLALMLCLTSPAWAADYPPLCLEVNADHPLFLFQFALPDGIAIDAYARQAVQAWNDLPHEFKPFSALQIDTREPDAATRHRRFFELLKVLQDAGVPCVIRLADTDPRRIYPLNLAEELISDFTCVKGIQITSAPLEEYNEFGDLDALGAPPMARWMTGVLDLAARYGRLTLIELDALRWPRLMTNPWYKTLYDQMRGCAEYWVPIAACRDAHLIPNATAAMGLWLEDATAQWGIGPQSAWYANARFIEPGVFGYADPPAKMPPSVYRSMILLGALGGASVYSFSPGTDLWFGPAQHHWHESIFPTLTELLDRGLIARRDFVAKRARVAYQLAPARNPDEFHLNLRDIDGVLDQGFMMRGAYGMERPGQVPELIPNSGRGYLIPLLSPYAPEKNLAAFNTVIKPGQLTSADAWTELINRYNDPDGQGNAFLTHVGRGFFVLNTRENAFESQTFRIDELPAPVRGLEAKRGDTGIEVTWPFREGDVSYRVYRRVLPETHFTLAAKDVDQRKFVDTAADANATIAYAVSALTNEAEPYEGTVQYGEYLMFSAVESRIAEEVVIGPLLAYAQSQAIPATPAPPGNGQFDLALINTVPETNRPAAQAIAERIAAWERAVREKNLNATLDMYATTYEDPQAWRFQYARRAYQWFYERYDACAMTWQIRKWDFSALATSKQVDVWLFCRINGNAKTDPSGRFADIPAYFPRTQTGEIHITFTNDEGPWRILRTDPALPNFRDILSFSAGATPPFTAGPDTMPLP